MNSKLTDIDKLTLTYFTNNTQYQACTDEVNIKQRKEELIQLKEDKKFYKKRIIQLTKDLFIKKSSTKEMQKVFEQYIKGCIEHLKTLDKHDILQEEYKNMDLSHNLINNSIDNNQEEDYNAYIYKTDEKIIKMDDFVIIKKKPVEKKNNPKQKDINLKDPSLKLKGVKIKEKKEKNKNKEEKE